jgi:multisubunit Na+/H+ antiporter MnhE subunit
MRTVFWLVVWWLVLFGLWMLYVGQTTAENAVAGAIAAAVAVGFAAVLARLGLSRFAVDVGSLVRAATPLPWRLLRDFALITLALVRGRPAGRFVERELPTGSAGDRAVAGLLGSVAPNAYVVDFDRERKVTLVHELE